MTLSYELHELTSKFLVSIHTVHMHIDTNENTN